MSVRQRHIVGSGVAVLVGVGVGITINIVTERPSAGWVAALVALALAATAIEIGLKMSERVDGQEPQGSEPGARSNVSTHLAHGGTSYNAGGNNVVGMTTVQLIAVLTAIVIIVITVIIFAVLLGGRDDRDNGQPLPPGPGPVVPSDAGSPALSPSLAPLPRTPVPDQLVGTWSGGTDGATANWVYTFSADGDAEQTNGRIGVLRVGTVVVRKTTLTLHFPGRQPEEFRWQVSPIDGGSGYTFSNLQLDGLSYVRQDAEPATP